MALDDVLLATLNAGEISRLALARVDLAKLRTACETQTNFLPFVLGPAIFRPGLEYIAEVPGNTDGWLGEFYFDEDTKALLVVTATGLQFLVNDAFISRAAVSSTITNGTFATDISGWTYSSEAGASVTALAPGVKFTGTGSNFAWLDQQITVSGADTGTEHGLRVVVTNGTVTVMVGSTQGTGDYWDVSLGVGTHSIAVTPAGSFWIRVGGDDAFGDELSSVTIESSGDLSIDTGYAAADFSLLRYDQSADVVFVAAGKTTDTIGYKPQRIERRASDSRSWGIADYLLQVPDGPFRTANDTSTELTPSAVSGNITITASRGFFDSGHVGALFRLTQSGQTATATLAGSDQFTGNIRVTGLSNKNAGDPTTSQRVFTISITGTWAGASRRRSCAWVRHQRDAPPRRPLARLGRPSSLTSCAQPALYPRFSGKLPKNTPRSVPLNV